MSLNEERVGAYGRLMDAQIGLTQLRERRGLSQVNVADALGVSQPNVSRIEQEEDVYFSTLSRYVAALGGEIEVRAVFPDETLTLLRPRDHYTL